MRILDTQLHEAVRYNRDRQISTLLSIHNANPNVRVEQGLSALSLAVILGE